MRQFMLPALLVLAALPAAAQDRPLFLPTRDVAVTYQLTSGSYPPQQTHLYFSADANKLRIDSPGNGGFTVLDRAGGRRMLVNNQMQQYMVQPMDPAMADGFVLNSQMEYQRQGQDSVAGVACTNWRVSSAQTNGTACVSPDGVLLRGSGQGQNGVRTGLVATSVEYAPQAATLFDPPAGYRQIDPSQVPQQGGPDGAPAAPGATGGAPGGQ